MVFTFGKYADYPLTEVPAAYLHYAIEEFSSLPDVLRLQCRGELLRRLGGKLITQAEPLPAQTIDLKLLLQTTYRDMAKKHHPDTGGSTQAMQAINDFYQALTAA